MKPAIPTWVKILGLVGGAAGAVGVTLGSGGSALVAVLVGLGAFTSGLSGLFVPTGNGRPPDLTPAPDPAKLPPTPK